MKKHRVAVLVGLPAIALFVAAGMQASSDVPLTQAIAQLGSDLEALTQRVDRLERAGGAQPGGQQPLATAGPQSASTRAMTVDNIQQSDHTDDNSAEIQQLQTEIKALQNTLNSQKDTLEQFGGQAIQEGQGVGGSNYTNRGDVDRKIDAQRNIVGNYATQLSIKRERLDRLQRADNEPKQIIHGHNGQVVFMLQSKYNISGQLDNISPGDVVTWTGTLIGADDHSAGWLIDTIKKIQ